MRCFEQSGRLGVALNRNLPLYLCAKVIVSPYDLLLQDFIGFTETSSDSGSIHVAEKDSGKELRPRGITHDNRHAAYDIVAYYRGNQPLFLGMMFLLYNMVEFMFLTISVLQPQSVVVTEYCIHSDLT